MKREANRSNSASLFLFALRTHGEAPEPPREVKRVFLYPDNCKGIQSRTEGIQGKEAAPTE